MHQLSKNKIRKQMTMVAPLGRFNRADTKSPVIEPTVLITADAGSCCRKFLKKIPAIACGIVK